MIDKLACLRCEIENDLNESIHYININAAALLDDVCRAIGLTEEQIRYILGSGYSEISLNEDDDIITPGGPQISGVSSVVGVGETEAGLLGNCPFAEECGLTPVAADQHSKHQFAIDIINDAARERPDLF